MFKRNIRAHVEKALQRSPVVLLTGARQTGKTTLMKQIGKENEYHYVTFDDIRFLSAAQSDPIGFIEGLKKPVILDEVQRIPEIFLAIKHDVDENRQPGRYALTGSANPMLIPRLGDSLAGRMEIFNLFPLSQGELLGRYELFIDKIFNQDIPRVSEITTKTDIYTKMNTGGYPVVQNIDAKARESWFNSYVTTLLQRDVKDIANIVGLSELPLLLKLLATRAGTLLNVAELSRTSGISTTTLHRYLVILKALFLIDFQLPWSSNLGKRLVKAPKVNLVDSGILSFLLGIDIAAPHIDGRILGPIVENFVVSELCKQITWNQTRVQLFHSRTVTGIEVDILLEDASGRIVCIEIKNSSTVTAQDFKGLKYMQELIGDKFVQGIVLYMGDQHIPFGARMHALPMNTLWGT
jgi:predicted AAA+ superfamily ATPase